MLNCLVHIVECFGYVFAFGDDDQIVAPGDLNQLVNRMLVNCATACCVISNSFKIKEILSSDAFKVSLRKTLHIWEFRHQVGTQLL